MKHLFLVFISISLISACANRDLDYQNAKGSVTYNPSVETREIYDQMPILAQAKDVGGKLPEKSELAILRPVPGILPEISDNQTTSFSELFTSRTIIAQVGTNSRNQPSLVTSFPQQLFINYLEDFAKISRSEIKNDSFEGHALINVNQEIAQLKWFQTLDNIYVVLKSEDGEDYFDDLQSREWLVKFAKYLRKDNS